MKYRIDKEDLIKTLRAWDGFLKRKVRLIACGGTALTLQGIKESTKDIDLIVPVEKEHDYLIKTLQQLGYRSVSGSGWARDEGFVFDLFRGPRVHTTEFLDSPLSPGRHRVFKELRHIYLGILNDEDLVISKLFRGTSVDIEDCLLLVRARKNDFNIGRLTARYRETASFDISQDRVNQTLESFLALLKKEVRKE